MVTAQDVYEYLAQAGPVLPKHVAEAFSISTLFASAFLSELSSNGKVSTSHLKIGGSPLYYTATHRDRLVDYRGNLHEKEQKTFELLRSERVLDDTKLELLDRVALRKMEDFAVPLAVDVGGTRRIFWKYYLAPDDQVTALIGEILQSETIAEPIAAPEAARVERPVEQHVTRESIGAETHEATGAREEPTDTHRTEERSIEGSSPQENRTEHGAPKRDEGRDPDVISAPSDPTSERARSAQRSSAHVEKKREAQAKIPVTPTNVTITQAPDASEALAPDPLGKRVLEYFTERTIRIIEAEVVRKNTCQGVCSVPSSVGELDYYFFAKDKKSITDKDIKEAFAEAAILGYPLLFIAKGDVKKSATELIGSKIKGSVIIEL